MKDIDIFQSGPIIWDYEKEESPYIFRKRFDELELVIVPSKREFIDELTEIVTYEKRYRLYLKDVYQELGIPFEDYNLYGYYWEWDSNGNPLGGHLP